MKSLFSRTALAMALVVGAGSAAIAQDVHFTQFNAAPLTINPAFTGAFAGTFRASAIYRDQWRSVTVPFRTIAVSVDAPVKEDLSTDDMLAVGFQLYNDKAGDGNLSNLTALGSVAYHKFLGYDAKKAISIGIQGGYAQKSIDLSKLYFTDEFQNGTFNQGTSAEYPYLNNKVDYWLINAGVAYSQAVSDRFSFSVGAGGNNLNQPNESFRRKRNAEVGLRMRYTGQLGAIAYLNDKFSLRPAVLYQSQATATEIVAGNEFNYILGNPEFPSVATAVFLGGWWRSNDAAMLTAGLEFKGFRFGLSYDYNTSALKSSSNGNGGFEISLRYIAPRPLDFAKRLVYPCSRF